MRRRVFATMMMMTMMAAAGCADPPPSDIGSGSLGGLAIMSGPLRGARITIEQLDDVTGEVFAQVGEATTDDTGHFAIPTGTHSGVLLITAHGGRFVDQAQRATIALDPTDTLESVTTAELLEQRDDVLVSPIGQLIVARMRHDLAVGAKDVATAQQQAAQHLDTHFGNVDWTRARPGGLDAPAPSPTEAVRAALVQVGLSYLVQDIAQQAQASPQEVNVYTLTRAWATDLMADGGFDGNDGNNKAFGSGLQLGVCPAVASTCVVPGTGCVTGACRTLCDLYVGTPRALLAGVLTKVIQNPEVNKTDLATADILPLARAMAENVDDQLFAGSCVETLDRLPPTIQFTAPTPDEAKPVRRTQTLKAAAIDDIDPNPQIQVVGLTPAATGTVEAVIDTTKLGEGPNAISVTAIDLAGNRATALRTLLVDNLAPFVALATTGFFVDGSTLWSASATPTLTGDVNDASAVSVTVTIGASSLPAQVSNGSWSLTLPAGTIDVLGKDVTIRAVDEAGNTASRVQNIRVDTTPPTVTPKASTVHDEATDQLSFTGGLAPQPSDEIPVHNHSGPLVDLAAQGSCATITKFSYLLDAAPPAYGKELDSGNQIQRNPLHYAFDAGDTGVGLVTGSTQYRVGRRQGTTTTWLTPFLSAGTGSAGAPGFRTFDVAIVADTVPGLRTTDGVYDVEFHATDRLARTTTETRCFDLKLRAPPLNFASKAVGLPEPGPAVGHPFALNSLSLSAGPGLFEIVGQRLLNFPAPVGNGTGASLLDQAFTNGTAETVFLTVDITSRPSAISAMMSFHVGNSAVAQSTTAAATCPGNAACCPTSTTGPCTSPPLGPVHDGSTGMPVTTMNPDVFVKVFELNAANVPTTEIPCIGVCLPASPTNTAFQFAIPPRQGTDQPFRKFVAMTMIGQQTALWPSDTASQSNPPYVDFDLDPLTGPFRITGGSNANVTGCTEVQLNPQGKPFCAETTTFTPYRMLRSARLDFADDTKSTYATSATPMLTPVTVTQARRLKTLNWITQEPFLP